MRVCPHVHALMICFPIFVLLIFVILHYCKFTKKVFKISGAKLPQKWLQKL